MKLSEFINESITQEDFYDFYALNLIPVGFDSDTDYLRKANIEKIKKDYIEFLTKEVYDELRLTQLGFIKGQSMEGMRKYFIRKVHGDDPTDEDLYDWAKESGFVKDRRSIKLFELKTGIQYRQLKAWQSNPYHFSLEQLLAIYKYYPWTGGYGGKNWVRATDLLIKLKGSSDMATDSIYIDQIHDLEHNSGHLFNKRREYHDWMGMALNIKAGQNSVREIMPHLSRDVRSKLNLWLRLNPERNIPKNNNNNNDDSDNEEEQEEE